MESTKDSYLQKDEKREVWLSWDLNMYEKQKASLVFFIIIILNEYIAMKNTDSLQHWPFLFV